MTLRKSSTIRRAIPPIVFAFLTFMSFGRSLFAPPFRAIGSPAGDLLLQFVAWRKFGFSQIASGHFPLWNPHIFGGVPYFAGFQSALLYPPNWLHLIFQMGQAIDCVIALHVFAAGYFTYLWCRQRASMIGSMVGGTIFMFCGPFFLHIFPGHLPHLAAIVWIPLILLAVDGIFGEQNIWRWWLLGAFAMAMQIFAGHPQYVYYTAIVAAIYVCLTVIARWKEQSRIVLAKKTLLIGAMYFAAALLSSVQLLPGISAAKDSVRSGGLSYEMAGTFSLPPENLVTLFAPDVLGSLDIPGRATATGLQYFGADYLWEASLFAGAGGTMLAILGACFAAHGRARKLALAMILICLLLALGRHSPIYSILYRFAPMYGSFRGTSKFAAPMSVFVALLAAMGFDCVQQRRALIATILCAALLASLAGFIAISSHAGTSGGWGKMLARIEATHTGGDDNEFFSDNSAADYSDRPFIRATGAHAAKGVATAAAIVAAIALCTVALHFKSWIALVIPLIVVGEMLIVARGSITTCSVDLQLPQTWLDAITRLKTDTPDARVLVPDVENQNAGMVFGFDDIWGYDPGVLRRYAELLAYSQGNPPTSAKQYLAFHQPSPNIFRALRCAGVLLHDANRPMIAFAPPLPTALLLRNYRVMDSRDSLLAAFVSETFDPASSVLLETDPQPRPIKGESTGTVEAINLGTDSLEVHVDIATPAILLVTNNFTPDWHARSLDANPAQNGYEIQPANWAHMAIPLQAGKHHLLIEYLPTSYRIGKWISICAWPALLAGAFLAEKRRRNERSPVTE